MEKQHNFVYLREVELKDYKSFSGDNKFSFVTEIREGDERRFHIPQCTVFLGDNGTGKTNLLKVIANMIPSRIDITDKKSVSHEDVSKTDDRGEVIYEAGIHISQEGIKDEARERITHRPKVIDRYKGADYSNTISFAIHRGEQAKLRKGEFQILRTTLRDFVKDGRKYETFAPVTIGYGKSQNNVTFGHPELDDIAVFGYGVNRFADTQRNLKSGGTVDTLFDNNTPLINLEEWLLQLEFAISDKSQSKKAHKRLNMLRKVFKNSDLFPDIEDFVVHRDEDLNTSILFRTSNGDYPMHELGYGYQCMFAWVFDFIKKLIERYPDSDNPLAESAVLLLDEVDLHLHPQWQRHVLKDLCDLFPNTQIIATTHSPLVIQSADNMNLYVLKNEDGKTTYRKYEATTFQGWSVDDILGELMDLGKEGVRSVSYLKLRSELDHAMNAGNVDESIRLYKVLKRMLHPGSQEAEDLELDIEDLKDLKK